MSEWRHGQLTVCGIGWAKMLGWGAGGPSSEIFEYLDVLWCSLTEY